MNFADDLNGYLKQIAKALTLAGRFYDLNPLVPSPHGGRIRVASHTLDKQPPHLADGTLRERINLPKVRAYTLRLTDEALIQLMWEFEGKHLVKHRYAWLPAPLPPADEDGEAMTAEERLGSSLESVAHRLRLGGALRIDFDASAAGPTHPATHLTLFGAGMEEGRLPIRGPWCLGRFFRFLFGQVAPPTIEIDGRKVVDELQRRALVNAVPVTSEGLNIDLEQTDLAWLAWGRFSTSSSLDRAGTQSAARRKR